MEQPAKWAVGGTDQMGRPGKGRDSMMQKQQNIQPDGRSQADCGFSDAKNHFHAVSLSGGKDSTAMLLLMIERGVPIDAVLYADTGMEFPEMYGHLQKLDDRLYEIYHRASCWCCPFQRIDELRKLRLHHPELWSRLLEMDERARAQFGTGPLGQFKTRWSVAELDARFAAEESQ